MRALLLTLALLTALPASARTCRQALVLGLDVSLSVNFHEFRLQREGLARALTDPAVADAMLSPAGHVELAIFEWSGQYDQNLLIGWTVIDSRATLDVLSATLMRAPQGARTGRTAIGAAMLFARTLLMDRPDCAARTLDLSGDGMNNNGAAPEQVRERLAAADIVVNGLAIELSPFEAGRGPGSPQLSLYFQERVISGPSSFVETIYGFENYEDAIRRKLLRELTPAVAQRRARSPRVETASGDGFRRHDITIPPFGAAGG